MIPLSYNIDQFDRTAGGWSRQVHVNDCI